MRTLTVSLCRPATADRSAAELYWRGLNAEPADVGSAVPCGMRKLDDQHLQRRRKCDLLATVTHLIRVRQVAPVINFASLMASPVHIAISWQRVEWRVVKWYLPGAMAGAMLGGWLLSWARGEWLTTGCVCPLAQIR